MEQRHGGKKAENMSLLRQRAASFLRSLSLLPFPTDPNLHPLLPKIVKSFSWDFSPFTLFESLTRPDIPPHYPKSSREIENRKAGYIHRNTQIYVTQTLWEPKIQESRAKSVCMIEGVQHSAENVDAVYEHVLREQCTFPPRLKTEGNIRGHKRAGGEWRGWDPFQGDEISQDS